jgi:hypothetical protein
MNIIIERHKGMSRKDRRILRRLANKKWRDTSHAHKEALRRLNIRRQYRVTRAGFDGVEYIDFSDVIIKSYYTFDPNIISNQSHNFLSFKNLNNQLKEYPRRR